MDPGWFDGPIRPVHFVGIGGYGMAGLARLLRDAGGVVSGSDAQDSALMAWLREAGVAARVGHDPGAIPAEAEWLVRTSAVPDSHPVCVAARERGLPIFRRGEVLAAWSQRSTTVAVSGTHGKTTTSSMIAYLLRQAELDPGHAIGADTAWLDGPGSGGSGDLLVVEADESDGTLVHYQPQVGVITNIEFDHMETFSNAEAFVENFRVFARRCERVVWCADDAATVEVVCEAGAAGDGFGFSEGADWRATEVVYKPDEAMFTVRVQGMPRGQVVLPVTGRHQVLNALAAMASASYLIGIEAAVGLPWQGFALPGRRYEVVEGNATWKVVHDYAHHPTEIRTVIDVAQLQHGGRLVVLYQPHRYTRTKALLHDFPAAFSGADYVVLAPVFAASEEPIEGGTGADLAACCAAALDVPVVFGESLAEAARLTREQVGAGDLLLVLGAGDVVALAGPLAAE